LFLRGKNRFSLKLPANKSILPQSPEDRKTEMAIRSGEGTIRGKGIVPPAIVDNRVIVKISNYQKKSCILREGAAHHPAGDERLRDFLVDSVR
jgi:hypothetical protein